MSSSRPSSASSQVAGFGTNEWLVEEMYQQYLADPSSVDQAWHEFFADYRPSGPVSGSADREEPAAPAAALLHLGPGLGNGLANLHNARRGKAPLLNVV
ncbi:2-oxoglutarate dehydrogenase E1 subunit family protein, partial [Blastococcus saxobsidens]|uniref:2-oxoglutarate dehydrogenase E1 subunit family protein n=1 Tax=Blastococcus saxobsidens TaxID=138336 RepID=UPI002012E5BF